MAGLYAVGLASGNRRVEDLGLHLGVDLSPHDNGRDKDHRRTRAARISKDNAELPVFPGTEGDDYGSFPSGHTTAAFAFASIVTAETSHWWL